MFYSCQSFFIDEANQLAIFNLIRTFTLSWLRIKIRVMNNKSSKIYSYSVFYEMAQEGGYIASVPSLPGCHSQGDTLEETEANIKEAVEIYLESLYFYKEIIPEEKQSFQGTVKVTMPLTR